MFTKNLEITFLLDFYGEVLSSRTREMLEMYYCDDLSLSEIAENIGISRQGARQSIKKGEEELLLLEAKLGLANRHLALKQVAGTLLSLASSLEKESDSEGVRSLSLAARACAEEILAENQN